MRRPSTPEAAIEKFCWHLTNETSNKKRTVNDYCSTLGVIVRFFRDHGRECFPWEVGKEDIIWLLDMMIKRNLKVSTRKSYVTVLKLWCSYYGNEEPSKFKIKWPKDTRPNADWINESQAKNLLAQEMTPCEELLVHCELCLGMRRIEVLRLTVHSFQGSYIDILGKGAQDGKPRRMPYHPDTARVLTRFFNYRNALIALASARRPKTTVVPDNLLIFLKGYVLKTYSEKGSGLDAWLKKLGMKIGYPDLSHHTLRRMFGRTMFKSLISKPNSNREGVLVLISAMMGIDDIRVLIEYLGINLDDMAEAMEAFLL